jgi:hypothetical protein
VRFDLDRGRRRFQTGSTMQCKRARRRVVFDFFAESLGLVPAPARQPTDYARSRCVRGSMDEHRFRQQTRTRRSPCRLLRGARGARLRHQRAPAAGALVETRHLLVLAVFPNGALRRPHAPLQQVRRVNLVPFPRTPTA